MEKTKLPFIDSDLYALLNWSRRGRDHMVVGFTTTCAISDYHHWSCEFEPHSLQGVLDTTFVIKFVSDGYIRSGDVCIGESNNSNGFEF
jgi:hypothetical protein